MGVCTMMALPTLSSSWHSRSRVLEQQIVRHREQEARFRHQWDVTNQYFKQSNVCSSKQAQWSSRQSYQQSMNAYHREKQKEEKKNNLDRRKEQLRKLLQEERDMLEAELKELRLNKEPAITQMRERTEELKSAREERRKQLAEELLYENWKKNNDKLREVEHSLHKKHVVDAWCEQVTEKNQERAAEDEEKRRYENEYELARREAIERMKREEERRREAEEERAQVLRQQIDELKLRELEAKKLKREQEDLLRHQWEVEELEEQRKFMEERRKKTELGHFLSRQYTAQMKRRAQLVQQELEMDMKILAALINKEDDQMRLQSARREQAAADAAWMKRVIEEQLRLERQREAELDTLFREEAKQVWAKREAEWERERNARNRLMKEVLAERQLQIQERIEQNQRAQKEALKIREQLIRDLEDAKQLTSREKKEVEEQRTARRLELEAQISERCLQENKAILQLEEEDREARLAEDKENDLLQQEEEIMTQRGYQKKSFGRPRTAWS
ncbi:trichoplein keratin filament-binding protein isoform X1 [Bombina bombina]|uniref:trichoplein keratin filament-binding protein isoform X1 n=2 Tax=Bombina bombina TaxID=8345 RepID=UPI00235A494A|nr:trichoplein keratin filament-binding protein isoform X1 [Bombina bombina]